MPISTVLPSGSALATCLPAMMPAAPPRFSTTTVWPSSVLSLSANSRATAFDTAARREADDHDAERTRVVLRKCRQGGDGDRQSGESGEQARHWLSLRWSVGSLTGFCVHGTSETVRRWRCGTMERRGYGHGEKDQVGHAQGRRRDEVGGRRRVGAAAAAATGVVVSRVAGAISKGGQQLGNAEPALKRAAAKTASEPILPARKRRAAAKRRTPAARKKRPRPARSPEE